MVLTLESVYSFQNINSLTSFTSFSLHKCFVFEIITWYHDKIFSHMAIHEFASLPSSMKVVRRLCAFGLQRWSDYGELPFLDLFGTV